MGEKHSEQAKQFDNELKSIIKKIKFRENLVTAGESNVKTESAALETNFHQKQIKFTENQN